MIRITDASTNDISVIRDIAEAAWWPTYQSILTPGQIRYMLDQIYAPDVLQTLITNGSQHFILLWERSHCVGFASYAPREAEPHIVKIHKLYVLPACHGKGYGKRLVEEIKTRVASTDGAALELNVNRFNVAKQFYERVGFRVVREEDIPIGPYWMNDYVMRLDINISDVGTNVP